MHDLRLDHVRQTVRVEQVDVVRLDPILDDVGRHDRLDAERSRDEILVERILGLLHGQHAAVDLLLQQRMVVRELLELFAAHPVAARVADVADRDAIAAEHRGDDRRAHAGAFGPLLGRFVDAFVRGGDLLLQQQRRVREACRHVNLRELAPRFELRHHAVGDHVDGDAARDFAGVVAAHAVGEHGDARLGIDEHGVFVMRTNHAGMRQGGCVERRVIGHRGHTYGRRARRVAEV